MKEITFAAILICALSIFFVKRPYKVGIMLLGTMLFTYVRIPGIPLQDPNSLFPFCFLVSELPHLRRLIKEAKSTIVWKLMGLAILMTITTIIFSPHLRDFTSIRYFLQGYLFFYYFGLIYSFWCIKSEDSIKPTLKITFIGMLILTAFGVVNYITQGSDFISIMGAGRETDTGVDAGDVYATTDRFRVQAMFGNAFDYGYICILIFLLHLYGYSKKMEGKIKFLIIAACSIFGVISCGCRTNLFCFLIGLSVFSLLAFKSRKSIKGFLILLFGLVVAYQTVPDVEDKVDEMMTMFDKNSKYEGSSVDMRALQYATVLYYIQDSPFFGRGYKFFNIDMGWSEGRKYLKDDRLQGMEGVMMSYTLERGIVGLAMYLIFWISLVVYMFKRRKISKPVTALGLSVLATYLSFANMTGELLSVYPTLLLLGFCIKVLETKKNEVTMSNKIDKA